jgi:hypothetical protein
MLVLGQDIYAAPLDTSSRAPLPELPSYLSESTAEYLWVGHPQQKCGLDGLDVSIVCRRKRLARPGVCPCGLVGWWESWESEGQNDDSPDREKA